MLSERPTRTKLVNPPLPDGGSAMVCVSSLFAYKYKYPYQSACKRLSGTEPQNHGGHAVPFLMELFGKVESWHEKLYLHLFQALLRKGFLFDEKNFYI